MNRIGRGLFAGLRGGRSAPGSVAVGDVLGYRAPSGRVYLVRVVALLNMGAGCVQPAIRFLDYCEPELPAPDQLASIPYRQRHPRWKKVELRIVDDEAPTRERLGLTKVGTVESRDSTTASDPKAACEWADVVAYLNTRDQPDQRLGPGT